MRPDQNRAEPGRLHGLVKIKLDRRCKTVFIINRQRARPTADNYMRPFSHAFLALNGRGGSSTRSAAEKGLFAFQTRNAAQASYSRSGAFLKWFDVSPYHKRVEAYSADYDPGTRGLCRPAHRVPCVRLAACPIDDRCKETLTPIYLGMGLLCPKNP
jgi:hypothetical protein